MAREMRYFPLLLLLVSLSTAEVPAAPGSAHPAPPSTRFKTEVPAGKDDCYFVVIERPATLHAAYLVISPNTAHDISFSISRVGHHQPLVSDERQRVGIHSVNVDPGELRVCLVNSHSFQTPKIVSFTVSVEENQPAAEKEQPVDGVHLAIDRIKSKMAEAKRLLNERADVELRDRFVAETTFEDVNFWGITNTAGMLLSAAIQVLMIRRLVK